MASQTEPLSPLERYDGLIAAQRHSRYMDYPKHVHLETLALCNAACGFCPYPTLERQGESMSEELIAKIVNDLRAIPSDLPFQLSAFKVNEPFLDKRIFDILALFNDWLPNALLTLTTNASPLTDAKLDALARVRRLSCLWISFNDHRPEQYEEVMRLPYARTVERLDAMHARRASGALPFRVVLSRVGDRSPIDAQFRSWVAEHYPAFESMVLPRGTWLGQVDADVAEVPNIGCLRWFELSITATGQVAHCCMDGRAKWPIGDVTEQSVLEVYNAPHYRNLRERTVSRLHVEPCNTCTFQ